MSATNFRTTHGAAGGSLTELLVVVAIMSIVSAMALHFGVATIARVRAIFEPWS